VRFRGFAIACLSLAACSATPTFAQFDEPSEQLQISADTAATWDKAGEQVVSLEGPVKIVLDQATLTAKQAVIWLSRTPGPGNRDQAQIALIGDAKVVQKDATRSGERLFVTVLVTGKIRFSAEARVDEDRSNTEIYAIAEGLRRASADAPGDPLAPPPRVPDAQATAPMPIEPAPEVTVPVPRTTSRPSRPVAAPASQQPTTAPTTAPAAPVAPPPTYPGEPMIFHFGAYETFDSEDGTVAVVLTDGVTLFQRSPKGTLELQADEVVLFTTIKSLKGEIPALMKSDDFSKSLVAAYLEGDVRINFVPVDQSTIGEQRLEAKRVYYEFATDRAVLTDAVVHTVQPQMQIPVVMRAKIIRQLSIGEFRATSSKLSTSRFATPSYSINASRMYVRQEDTGDPRLGNRTIFSVSQPTFRFFNVPVFWLPGASGSMTDRGTVLRGLGFENSNQFGAGIETKWGLFETLGKTHPNELDVTYDVNYYGDRGPALGLDAKYGGGAVSDLDRQFNFEGEFTAYGVLDSGFDDFGRGRVGEYNRLFEDETHRRGRLLYQHQHFFSDDYQLQVRAGYVTDATFLEQWFDHDFDEGPPHDVNLYLKRQIDTEAYTVLTQFQPSNLVTTSELLQEQFEVERLPEVGYRRIGDSFADDRLTFFSRNTVGGYRFNTTRAELVEQGFGPGRLPGIPSIGYTGVDQDTTLRGDFRQEITAPIEAGPVKILPYVVGRYTGYSDSPDDSNVNRLYGAVGARASTAFWRQYDHVESRLFDVHRVRHVIEPEINVFAAAATEDRNDVFVYEEDVDGIHDLSAVQFALRQRWQTKRGGPGRWRSVDFFTLNVDVNLFANEPDEEEDLPPRGFRGLYFPSQPEASIPRNSANAQAIWRLSDNTAIVADAQENLREERLATAGLGLIALRDERLIYFIGTRYIDEVASNVTTIAVQYDLTPRYSLSLVQSYDFIADGNVVSAVSLLRQFDSFFVQASVVHDATSDLSSFNFNIFPKGLGYGVNAAQLGNVFRNDEDD
jgi:lipopolysaccharide export system protein LptA